MPHQRDETLPSSEIHERTRRFASLRAAQRALGRSVHPSELSLASQRSRQILILLQDLSVRVKDVEGETRQHASVAPIEADLCRVDQLLDDISIRTRELLAGLELAQLRSSVPLLCAQHPDEVCGLVDVLLEGDLEDDKQLRMLEYLVTVLASEDRDGRRILAGDPSQVTPRLQEFARGLEATDTDYLLAEKSFDNTMTLLHGGEDVGVIRDRVRRYKEELGPSILHPRILKVVVGYNVAMWNQVADLIDGSRSIDHLADELLGTNADRAEAPEPAAAEPPPDSPDVLGSSGFARILEVLRDRVGQRRSADELARKVVTPFELGDLDPADLAALENQDEDEVARLTRAAVGLGLTIRHEAQVNDLLHALGLDAELLRTVGISQLSSGMTAAARRLFAECRYEEAFRLSEVKTRNLVGIQASSAGAEGASAGSDRSGRRRGAAGRHGAFHLDSGLPAGQVWVVVLLLALPLIAGVLWTSRRDVVIISSDEISRISPFLESGYRRAQGDHVEFVGRLNRGWDYLPRRERLRVTAEIGIAVRETGVDGVVLEDEWKIVQARYDDGPRLEELPRLSPAPQPPPRP